MDIDPDERRAQTAQYEQAGIDADIRYPEEAEAETIDHIEDGIPRGYRLPERRQGRDGIEDAPQIRERSQDESRDDRDAVEILGIHPVEQSRQRKEKRREKNEYHCQKNTVYRQMREEQRYAEHQRAREQPPQHAAGHIASHYQRRRQGRNQNFFDLVLEFGAEKRSRHIGE